MKRCPDNDGSTDGNNTDNNSGGGSDGPPRKKAQTMTLVNNDSHFTMPMPEHDNCVDNNGMFLNAIPTDANYSIEMSLSNSES